MRWLLVPVCYFIEKDPAAFACLNAALRTHGYADRIGKTIHVYRKRFEAVVPTIIRDINTRHTRGGNRTIFFLDQCGWSRISAGTVRQIFYELHHRPEFIVNFAISWLMDFVSQKTRASKVKSLQELGLAAFVDLDAMMKRKLELGGRWEHVVEAHIGEAFHRATGIPYFSPFYIEPGGNHRGYWLLHLAGSARARSAMTQVHWSKANRSKHYGHPGCDMLSYKPDGDLTQFIDGMSFDDESRKRCEVSLSQDFPRLIRDSHEDGITFKALLDKTSNKIIASAPMVQEVVVEMCQGKDFELLCPSGRAKKSPKVADHDIIRPRRQFLLTGLNFGSERRAQLSSSAYRPA